MNSVNARGSSGLLSGWFIRLNLLYAFLISFNSAFGSTPRILKVPKDLWLDLADFVINEYPYEPERHDKSYLNIEALAHLFLRVSLFDHLLALYTLAIILIIKFFVYLTFSLQNTHI